jgi:hypothetical protein
MAGKFQPPPVQQNTFLDPYSQAPNLAWQRWFELIPPAIGAPATSGDVPSAENNFQGIQGQIATDGNFLYICTGANQWKRVALSAL